MFEKLQALIGAITLTRLIVIMISSIIFWVMVIFTLEFVGVIDIDVQCGIKCMHLIDSIFSLVKTAKASGFEFDTGSPAAALIVHVTLLP